MRRKGVRIAVLLVAALLLLGTMLQAQTGEPLKILGERAGKMIGTIVPSSNSVFSDNLIYRELLEKHFNLFTPEMAMMFSFLQPARGQFNFSSADNLVRYAKSENLAILSNSLILNPSMPGWLQISNREQLVQEMENHIKTVLTHFRGDIFGWDVVSEAFYEDGSLKRNFWHNIVGPDYIEMAFRFAGESDPDSKLIYNDYNIAEVNAKSDAIYNMVKTFLEQGVPIDAIGFEMHLDDKGIDYNSFAENMARFAALGLEIWITEMDVRISPMPSEADLENQANIYRQVVSRVMNEPACRVFQTWGITDSYSWIPTTFPGSDNPLLWDKDYNPKPAFYAVQEELAKTAATPLPTPVPRDVILEFVPSLRTVATESSFELRLSMSNRKSIGSYEIEIEFDSQFITPDTSVYKDAYIHGADGLSDPVLNIVEPPFQGMVIQGHDVSGSEIGTDLDLLHLFFKAGSVPGRTEVIVKVNELIGIDGSSLTRRTLPVTIIIEEKKSCTLLGDGNDDGYVNIVDALLMAQVYVKLPGVKANVGCLDINCDGKVNIVDALELAQKYVSTAPMVFSCP